MTAASLGAGLDKIITSARSGFVTDLDFIRSYQKHVLQLQERLDRSKALRDAVGGEFVAVGKLEFFLLRSLGLTGNHCVIDVGCGSGRLAAQLASMPRLRYLGLDVVPDLLAFAEEIAGREDWKFELTDGRGIPADAESADYVCFFSVFTHLLHEESYRYLREAYRVLKAGGLAVFSFLEFRIECHWNVFEAMISSPGGGAHLNQFMDRDAIIVWAKKIGFDVEGIYDGDRPHIPLPELIEWDNGTRMGSLGNLGQSVAVLKKPAAGRPEGA